MTRCSLPCLPTRYDAVVHFAGLKAVGESVAHPDMYYENNLVGTINLYKTMKKHGCMKVRAVPLDRPASVLPCDRLIDRARVRADGVLVVGDRVRLAGGDPVRRGRQAAGREPLRQDQGNHRLPRRSKLPIASHVCCGSRPLTTTWNGRDASSRRLLSPSRRAYLQLILEDMARDYHRADPEWGIVLLRYFNPIGAHSSGEIGEDPKGIPNNLLPYIQQVAVGRLTELNVYGHDYPTRDGTAVRAPLLFLPTKWSQEQSSTLTDYGG